MISAVEGKRDIMPFSIKYLEVNGEPLNKSNRDLVCWYGDMDFVPHFAKALGLQSVKVQVNFLEPIKVTAESTRDELAKKTYDAVSASYFGHKPV